MSKGKDELEDFTGKGLRKVGRATFL